MNVETHVPKGLLGAFVRNFTILESECDFRNRLLPATSVVLFFRLRGTVSYADGVEETPIPFSGVNGLRNKPRQFRHSKGAATLLVNFRAGGAPAFLGVPLHELFGMSVSLDEAMNPANVREVVDRLSEAKTHRERIGLAESFLLSSFMPPRTDELVMEAIRAMESSKGSLRIRDLVREMPISRDSFEKRFRRVIGTSPKRYASILRLRNVIAHYHAGTTLTDAALAAGYFDQAHFTKDFGAFTGLTPRQFFGAATICFNALGY